MDAGPAIHKADLGGVAGSWLLLSHLDNPISGWKSSLSSCVSVCILLSLSIHLSKNICSVLKMSRITYVCQLVCGYKEKLAEQVKLSLQTLLMGKKKGKNNRAPKNNECFGTSLNRCNPFYSMRQGLQNGSKLSTSAVSDVAVVMSSTRELGVKHDTGGWIHRGILPFKSLPPWRWEKGDRGGISAFQMKS